MAQKQQAYDHPLYLAVLPVATGQVNGSAGTSTKFAAFLDMKIKAITLRATTAGTSADVVNIVSVSGTTTTTTAYGTINAKAGANGGDGGVVETSGHHLILDGYRVSTESAYGLSGLWLLDPYDIAIGTTVSGTAFSSSGTDYIYTSAAGSYITASSIATALASTNVTIQTGSGGTGYGDILLNSPISYAGSATTTLTLKASRNIFLNEAISSSNGKLNLVVTSDHDNNSSGDQIRVGGNVTTLGGNVTLTGENIVFQGVTGQTISTVRTGETGGSFTVNGSTFLAVYNGATAANLVLNTGGGAVNFNGTVDNATDSLFQRIFDVTSDSNFDSLATTYGFNQISGASTNPFFENQRAFGQFVNQSIDLTFNNLNNSSVGLNFNFYAIDSWDGAAAEYFKVQISRDGGAFTDLFTLNPNWSTGFTNTSGSVSGYSYAVTLKQEGNLFGSNRGNYDQIDRKSVV